MLMTIGPARKKTKKRIERKTSIVMNTESETALVIETGTGVTGIVTEIVTGMIGVMTDTEMIVTETGGVTLVTDTRGTETTEKGTRRSAILTSLRRILTVIRDNRRASATKTRL